MEAARRLHHAAHVARIEVEGDLLKLLLHIATSKEAQVTTLAGRGAVRLVEGQFAERDGAGLDLLLVAFDDGHGLVLGTRNFRLSPAAGTPAPRVFDQQMGGANLALGRARSGTLMSSHILLELVGVGPRGRLPAGDCLDRVEVVRQILGVGVANLPVGRETGLSHGVL